jgi:hypothetical protein
VDHRQRFRGVPDGAILIPAQGRGPATPSLSALYETFGCRECGAQVLRNDLTLHSQWHQKLDRVIAWVQREEELDAEIRDIAEVENEIGGYD